MPELKFVPKVVDLHGYAGDTMGFTITLNPPDFADGKEWSGDIKLSRDLETTEAAFDITPTATGATVQLPGATTRALATVQGLMTTVEKTAAVGRMAATYSTIQRFSGEYDIQVAEVGGLDPITTFFQGAIVIDLDVTRVAP